jgi:hypothetical protein
MESRGSSLEASFPILEVLVGVKVNLSYYPFPYLNSMNPIQKLENSLDGSSPLHLVKECFLNYFFVGPMGIGLS